MLGEGAGGVLEFRIGEVDVFVAEAEDGRGFDTEEGDAFADGVLQEAQVGVDDRAGFFEQTLREVGASAFPMLGDFDRVAECFEQLDGFYAEGRVGVVGELVAEEEDFSKCSGLGMRFMFGVPGLECGWA